MYTPLDTSHEKLFLGRVAETLARQYKDDGETENYNKMVAYYFSEYPQLIPFSGIQIKIRLNLSGVNDDAIKKIITELEDCNINRVDDDSYTCIAGINFQKKKKKSIKLSR